ncbi:hypothetical protein MHBO_001690 [Bonamia ostreae]|uniref:Photosystem I assembly protein Ycf4 n=1 Tax=Bonamia ostreae TaxID=126728 RepID=A0ABV2AJV3_9EUKA
MLSKNFRLLSKKTRFRLNIRFFTKEKPIAKTPNLEQQKWEKKVELFEHNIRYPFLVLGSFGMYFLLRYNLDVLSGKFMLVFDALVLFMTITTAFVALLPPKRIIKVLLVRPPGIFKSDFQNHILKFEREKKYEFKVKDLKSKITIQRPIHIYNIYGPQNFRITVPLSISENNKEAVEVFKNIKPMNS